MGLVEESGAGEGNGPGRWKTQTQEEETQMLKRKKPKKDGRGRNGFWKLSDGDEGRKDDRWVERRFDDRDDDCGCTQGRVLIWLVAHTHQLATIRKSCCTGTRHYQFSLIWGSSTSSLNQSQETRTDSQNLLQYRFFHRFEREKKDGCIRVEEGDGDDCREKVEN
ncbi:unnamed protein product [Vicia faba]|uniref:Uncharacterized protein n=1 Tax=Vicia faba TaxID=3906 RepID=A0AAV1AXW6_VICFA|nr:unnamed protein product [Vicia faba]